MKNRPFNGILPPAMASMMQTGWLVFKFAGAMSLMHGKLICTFILFTKLISYG